MDIIPQNWFGLFQWPFSVDVKPKNVYTLNNIYSLNFYILSPFCNIIPKHNFMCANLP